MISAWRISSKWRAGYKPAAAYKAAPRLAGVFMLAAAAPLFAATVTGSVNVVGGRPQMGNSDVVVWLEPRDDNPPAMRPGTVQMIQHHKQFQPHVLAIPLGTAVDFPNFDPIFHNAFSNIDGKPFDVGLYPPGTSKRVVFDRTGIVHVFCNIHQAMNAVIVVQNTPWLAVTNRRGQFTMNNVPPGRYLLHVYYEQATKETLDALTRSIEVGPRTTTIAAIQVSETGYIELPHKNKYGRDYPTDDERSYNGAQ